MMSEPRQMNAVFLAGHCFCRFPLLHVEELDHLIVARSNQIVALVVKVDGGDERLAIGSRVTSKYLETCRWSSQ